MKATVTFEYDTRSPETWRSSEIDATSPQAVASKALRLARKALKPRGWGSCVVCIERGAKAEGQES